MCDAEDLGGLTVGQQVAGVGAFGGRDGQGAAGEVGGRPLHTAGGGGQTLRPGGSRPHHTVDPHGPGHTAPGRPHAVPRPPHGPPGPRPARPRLVAGHGVAPRASALGKGGSRTTPWGAGCTERTTRPARRPTPGTHLPGTVRRGPRRPAARRHGLDTRGLVRRTGVVGCPRAEHPEHFSQHTSPYPLRASGNRHQPAAGQGLRPTRSG